LQTELRETIADNLSKAGWSLGWVSAVDSQGRTIWIADAHRDGKHFIVRTDEKLSAFLQLDSAIVRQNFHLFCISKLAQESRDGNGIYAAISCMKLITLAICWLDGPPFISRQFFPDRTPEG
jgi:hypothetical protein